MASKYFTTEIKPIITPVTAGLTTAFSDNDVLFDWTPFQIPRGGGRLIGAHVEIRPKGDTGATPNKFPLELLFARHNTNAINIDLKYDGPGGIGAINTAPANLANIERVVDHYVGQVPFIAADFAESIDPIAIASTSDTNGIVLQNHQNYYNRGNIGEGTSGDSRFYVAGIAGGAFAFTSTCLIDNGDLDGPTMTVKDVDPRLFITPGDTVAVATTANTAITKAMGVVASLTDTTIVLTEAFTTADVVNEDIVYNTSPIRILLTFEV